MASRKRALKAPSGKNRIRRSGSAQRRHSKFIREMMETPPDGPLERITPVDFIQRRKAGFR